MIKLSIIVPVYNVNKYIYRFLDSIKRQSFSDYELILVNDGSTDNSGKICKEEASKSDNWIFISKQNQGSGLARNAGMQVATGEYILFFDPDDFIEENCLQRISDILSINSPDLLIFGYFDVIEYKNKQVKKTKKEIPYNCNLDKNKFIEMFPELFKDKLLYTLWNKAYSRKFIINNNLEFSNTQMGQDTRFNLLVYDCVEHVELSKYKFYDYVSERKKSATSNFNLNKFGLKLEEYELIKKFMSKNYINDPSLLYNLRIDIAIDSVNSLIKNNVSYKEFEKSANIICKRTGINSLSKKNISISLLQNKRYFIYFFLKRTQYLLKNIKHSIAKTNN